MPAGRTRRPAHGLPARHALPPGKAFGLPPGKAFGLAPLKAFGLAPGNPLGLTRGNTLWLKARIPPARNAVGPSRPALGLPAGLMARNPGVWLVPTRVPGGKAARELLCRHRPARLP